MPNVIEQASSSYHFLQSLLDTHADFFNVNTLTISDHYHGYKSKLIDNYHGYKKNLSYFFSRNVETFDFETQPLLTQRERDAYSFSKLFKTFFLILICLSVSGFASWLYWDDSQRAARRFQIQLGDGFIWFCFLVKYCCFLINLFLNTEVEILIMIMIYDLFNQSKSDRILMGIPNPILFLVSIAIGFFAELPFIKLAMISATTSDAETVNIFSAANAFFNYWFGALFVLMFTKLIVFSKTIDTSVRFFNAEDRKRLEEARDIIANNITNQIEPMLSERKAKNFSISEDIKKQLYLIREKNIYNQVTTNDLKSLFKLMGLCDRKPQPVLALPPLIHQSKLENVIAFLKKHINFDKENSKTKAKNFFYFIIIVGAIVTVINDLITAFFAAYDIFQSTFDKIFFGICAAFPTLAASGGFTYVAIKSLIGSQDPNIAKIIYPKIYLSIAAPLILIGFGSGGPSGLEGYLAFMRMLLVALAITAEILGFLGGVVSNIPFALKCLQRFILLFTRLYGDYEDKKLLSLILSIYTLQENIANMRRDQVKYLLKQGIFGDMNDLGIPPATQKLINSDHPSDTTSFYRSIP